MLASVCGGVSLFALPSLLGCSTLVDSEVIFRRLRDQLAMRQGELYVSISLTRVTQTFRPKKKFEEGTLRFQLHKKASVGVVCSCYFAIEPSTIVSS